ncbi:MAG: hypothetical protein K0R61_3671 [Microvirga sp.]|nr:hypothetical protein [Microvirga sp.]
MPYADVERSFLEATWERTVNMATSGAYSRTSTPVAAPHYHPLPRIAPPDSQSDWVGSDESGRWMSMKYNARVMRPGLGDEWWVQLGERWLNSDDGGIAEFPTARMAREQVERRREAERA